MGDKVPGKLIGPGFVPSEYGPVGSPNDLDEHLSEVDIELAAINAVLATAVQHKFDGVVAPGVNDDSGSGFAVGSRWVDIVLNTAYVCVDATLTAAIWDITSNDGVVNIIPFNNTSDWSGAGPFTMTKAHGFSSKNLFMTVLDSSDDPFALIGVDTTIDSTNIVFSVVTAPEQFAGTIIVSDGSTLGNGITPADLLTAIKTVDGSGSGLDADLLDGQEASAFAATAHSHVIDDTTGLQAALDLKANLAGPTFTGVPLSTTPAPLDDSTKIATTAFVQTELGSSGLAAWSPNITKTIHISEGGNDSTADGSLRLPYKTLAGAVVAKASSGTTAFRMHGRITEAGEFDWSALDDFALVGDDPATSILTQLTDGETVTNTASSGTQSNVAFINLTIENSKDNVISEAFSLLITGTAAIENLVIHNVRCKGRSGRIFELDSSASSVGIGKHIFDTITLEWGAKPTSGSNLAMLKTESDTPLLYKNVKLENLTFSTTGVFSFTSVQGGGGNKVVIDGLYSHVHEIVTTGGVTIVSGPIIVKNASIFIDAGTSTGDIIGFTGGLFINCSLRIVRNHSSTAAQTIGFTSLGSDGSTGLICTVQYTPIGSFGLRTTKCIEVKASDNVGDIFGELIIKPAGGVTVSQGAQDASAVKIEAGARVQNVQAMVRCSDAGIVSEIPPIMLGVSAGSKTVLGSFSAMLIEEAGTIAATTTGIETDTTGAGDVYVGKGVVLADVGSSLAKAIDRVNGAAETTIFREAGAISFNGFDASGVAGGIIAVDTDDTGTI